MRTSIKMFAITTALVVSASSAPMAQYVCPPGYTYYGGICQPMGSPGYSNPVSGAVSGEAAGAASGYRAAGPVGAVVGGALGTATGAAAGTANALTGAGTPPPPPACAPGFVYYNNACYPR